MDIRPNDHDHPALTRDLPDHVGNVDQFPPGERAAFIVSAGRWSVAPGRGLPIAEKMTWQPSAGGESASN